MKSILVIQLYSGGRKLKLYNLDVIISVGYRVKSQRGVLFRRWANSVLKQYLLKGYSIDSSRVVVTPENYLNLVNVVNRIDSKQTEIESRVESLENKNKETGHKIFFADKLANLILFIFGLVLSTNVFCVKLFISFFI